MTWAEQQLSERLEAEAKWEASRPICDICGEHILDEYLYEIGYERMCEDCAEEWLQDHKQAIEED